MQQDTRHLYNYLLRQSVSSNTFYTSIAAFLDNDPYFIPGYLEMAWFAQERNDIYLYKKILHYSLGIITEISTSKKVRDRLSATWTELERDAMIELLEILRAQTKLPFTQKALIFFQQWLADDLVAIKTNSSPKERMFLKHVETLDAIESLQAEIAALAPYWWHIDSGRREQITHHQDTWSFIIRELPQKISSYQPHDGMHESITTQYGNRLPLIHQTVLRFASRYSLALGRVAVVSLQPYSRVYRHFDSEKHLVGRKRYHLILQAGEKNILASGDECVNAQPGEIWFFDNKAMHCAHNCSSVLRIHVIFDGYPFLPKN